MQEDPAGERKKYPQAALLLIPLLILGFVLVGVGLYHGRGPGSMTLPTRAVVAASPLPSSAISVVDVAGDGVGVVSGPATPWAVAGGPGEPTAVPTPEPAMTTPPALALALLGPPGESVFQAGDVVTFYWSSPELSGDGRQFVVYLLNGDERLALGVVDKENLGLGYQLQAVLGQSVGQAGNYGWVVVLEDNSTGAIIGQSEIRSITILEDN